MVLGLVMKMETVEDSVGSCHEFGGGRGWWWAAHRLQGDSTYKRTCGTLRALDIQLICNLEDECALLQGQWYGPWLSKTDGGSAN